MPKNPKITGEKYKYSCKICDFYSNVFRDYHRHINTEKHNKMAKYNIYSKYATSDDVKKITDEDGVVLEVHRCVCGTAYRYAGSLSNHKKRCGLAQMDQKMKDKIRDTKAREIELKHLLEMKRAEYEYMSTLKELHESNVIITSEEAAAIGLGKSDVDSDDGVGDEPSLADSDATVISMLQSQTDELRKIVDATEKIKKELSEVKAQTPTQVVNNIQTLNAISTINNFNIVGFLNKECGHAMSLQDFLDGMELSMDDIYYTRDNGYVKGMSNAFIRQIENMGYNKRPIHCTDKKRLKFFIKTTEGGWIMITVTWKRQFLLSRRSI
jgi:hypothetical protein